MMNWKIRFVPGHSPGHVCFYHEAGGFVIAGEYCSMEASEELNCQVEIMLH